MNEVNIFLIDLKKSECYNFFEAIFSKNPVPCLLFTKQLYENQSFLTHKKTKAIDFQPFEKSPSMSCAHTHERVKDYKCVEVVLPLMTSEFGNIRNVIVTPDMIKRYFSMTKTEILVHLFLLSVCDEDRHIKRNVRALAKETKRWHADVYRAIIGLKLKKMLEEKQLKTKGGRYWRVYPLPRSREDKSTPALEEKAKQNSQPNGELKNSNIQKRTEGTAGASLNQQADNPELKGKGFLRWALEKIRRGKS